MGKSEPDAPAHLLWRLLPNSAKRVLTLLAAVTEIPPRGARFRRPCPYSELTFPVGLARPLRAILATELPT